MTSAVTTIAPYRRTSPRDLLRVAKARATGRLAAGLHSLFGRRSDETFAILMYHRVTDDVAEVEPPTWNVPPDRLREQLSGLLARGYQACPLRKLIAARRESRPVPASAFAVTFDDGYENNYSEAWPILRALGVPATIFLATAFLDSDHPLPFDDWSAAGSKRVPPSCWRALSTRQCRDMLASGLVDFGSHTHTHQKFIGRSHEFARDLACSLDVLGERFGIECPPFAFPFGAVSPELVDAARQAGVTCCLSTRSRCVHRDDDPFHWDRFYIAPTDTAATLAAKLAGWYTEIISVRQQASRRLSASVQSLRGLGDRARASLSHALFRKRSET